MLEFALGPGRLATLVVGQEEGPSLIEGESEIVGEDSGDPESLVMAALA
ncbi:MAG TPA: hypothetical protein VN957_27370 [Chthoniobacterales bacterium]|nr:hypothetical protein [Chthoniobacterales bacterium]